MDEPSESRSQAAGTESHLSSDDLPQGTMAESRRRFRSVAAAAFGALCVGAAAFAVVQVGGNDQPPPGQTEMPSTAVEREEPPSPGRAWCSDNTSDVRVQIGDFVRAGGQYDDTVGLDIVEVEVEVTTDELSVSLELAAPPSTYSNAGVYSYLVSLREPGSQASGPTDSLYTMLVGTSAAPGQAPTPTNSLTDATTSTPSRVPSASFSTDGNTINMRVPLDAVPALPRSFSFTASTSWALEYSDGGQGIYTDSCPADGPLPSFPSAGTTQHDQDASPSTTLASDNPTLAPATVPSDVPICDEPTQRIGTGFPISDCSAGDGINAQTWNWYADSFPAVLALGPNATADEIKAAACTATQSGPGASTSQIYSVVETAARYYSWPESSWANQISPLEC